MPLQGVFFFSKYWKPKNLVFEKGDLSNFFNYNDNVLSLARIIWQSRSIFGFADIFVSAIRGHPLSTYAKFSEKLTFLTPWYAQVLLVQMDILLKLAFYAWLYTFFISNPQSKNAFRMFQLFSIKQVVLMFMHKARLGIS